MRIPFVEVAIGRRFEFNGNIWLKRSARTAILASSSSRPTFYFHANDLVRV